MKPIFLKIPVLNLKLIIALVLSVTLISLENRNDTLVKVRSILDTVVGSFFYVANTPRFTLEEISQSFTSNNKLELENKVLKQSILMQNAQLLLLDQLKMENQRLRLLLNSPLRENEYKKITQVLTLNLDDNHQKIIIDQGENDGVFVGQPVIDEKGVVGQVVSVAKNTSRVMLITDVSSSIPLQVLRNDIRVIATGLGAKGKLSLDNVLQKTDIVKGDILVTSGLGGRYPEGYPVGVVEKVEHNESDFFANIYITSLASLESLRYLLLLWPNEEDLNRSQKLDHKEVAYILNQREKAIKNDNINQ